MDRAARPTRHVARRRLRNRCLLFATSVALLAGLLPSASVEAAAPAPAIHRAPAGAAGSGLQPTIQYEEALAHASDRIAFAPGDRVKVPFAPRTGDRWQVGGVSPRNLPAGRATGKAMRLPDGPPAPVKPTPPDQPTVPAADIQAADSATWGATDGAGTIQLAAAVDPGALRREVFGFLPYWELASSTTTFDWEALSTVAYFGVGADGAGNLMKSNADGSTTVGWSGWTSSRMTSVINAAHANHTRVVLTVQSFAWSTGGQNRQKALLGSPIARSRLASQIVAAVRDRGADGVNLDFEPIASGYADDFTAFVRLLRARLDASARGYQLTFDTTGFIGNYPIEAATAPGGADAIFIMGYDYRTAGSSPVGSVAPIGGPRYDISETIAAYAARVSPSKLILGVPYYGRAWSTSTATLNAANISGTKYGSSVTATYENAIALAAQNGRQYDPVEGVAWTVYRRQNCTAAYGCVNPWRELYYDDTTALSAKYALVNRYGLRGAGIWALGYDGTRPELYQALKDSFILDTIPPKVISTTLTSPIISPNGDRVLDTTTAVMRTTGLIRWGYLINPVSGTTVGSPLRTGSYAGKSPAYVWDGTGNAGKAPDGRYLITLWAADASNNRTQRQFPVTVDTRPAVASVGVGAGWLSPDGDGRRDTAPITWTADERLSGVTRVYNASGTPVRTWRFTGLTAWGTTWTGKDDLGRIVPDGRYVARLDGRDRAGNRTIVDRTINVDRTIRSVRWSASAFDPRARQTSRVTYTLSRRATVNVAIYRGTVLVRQITVGRVLLAGTYGWTWNGRSATGAYMAPGTYRALVIATSWIGTTAYSQSVIIRTH